jgi:hypothetical protein
MGNLIIAARLHDIGKMFNQILVDVFMELINEMIDEQNGDGIIDFKHLLNT